MENKLATTTTKFIYFSFGSAIPHLGIYPQTYLPTQKNTVWKRLLITEFFVAALKCSKTKDWLKNIMIQLYNEILWNKTKNQQTNKTTETILYLNCGTFINIYNYQNSSNYILKLNAIHRM